MLLPHLRSDVNGSCIVHCAAACRKFQLQCISRDSWGTDRLYLNLNKTYWTLSNCRGNHPSHENFDFWIFLNNKYTGIRYLTQHGQRVQSYVVGRYVQYLPCCMTRKLWEYWVAPCKVKLNCFTQDYNVKNSFTNHISSQVRICHHRSLRENSANLTYMELI